MRMVLYSRSGFSRRGGAESVFQKISEGLQGEEHFVFRVYNGWESGGTVSTPEQIRPQSWSLPLASIRTLYKIPKPYSIYAFCRSLIHLSRLVARASPRVVYVHYVDYCSIYFALLKPIFGYRLVLGGRGSDILRFENHNPSVQLFSTLALWSADHFVGVSQSVIDEAVRIAPSLEGKTTVIPNGVDPGFLDLSSNGEETALPVIATVGNLHSVKGHDVLIRAFSHLQGRHPKLELYVAGEGPERRELEQLTKRLGLQDQVVFLGWCGREEVKELLQKASLFVMPSRSEGFGLALVEAMATGLPIVASRVGGIPDLVDHERSGLLVPPEDPDALSESIDRILSDDSFASQLGAQAHARAQDFSWDRAIEKYEQVFERLA